MLNVESGAVALAHLQEEAEKSGYAELFRELQRIGPIEVAPSRHPTVADQLYVEVVNQQLSLKAANTIWSRVVTTAAELRLTLPEMFAGDSEDVLRACGVSARKVRSLHAIRAADRAGLLDREELRAMPHLDRSMRLCSIWGIGKWTADMIGIFHFLDPDIWPEGDVSAVSVFRRLTGMEDSTALTGPFAPFRSYLARYMWISRDNPSPAKVMVSE